MREPQKIYDEKEQAKKDPDAKPAALDNIDRERGHPGKGTTDATMKPEDTGDQSLENRRQDEGGKSHGDPEGKNPQPS